MCYFRNLSETHFRESRLIYQEDIGDKEPPLLGKKTNPKATLKALGDLKRDFETSYDASGKLVKKEVAIPPRKPRTEPGAAPPAGPKPPEVQKLLAIDPGDPGPGDDEVAKFPKLWPLLEEMDKISRKYDHTKIDPKVRSAYQPIIENFRRQYVYKAIVENWPEEALKAQYRKDIHDFYDRIGKLSWSTLVSQGMGKIVRAWHAVTESSDLSIGGENPHIANRSYQKIKLSESHRIRIDLINTGTQLRHDIIENKWEHRRLSKDGWVERNPDELKKEVVPIIDEEADFYAEFYTNTGIVENWSEQDVKLAYKTKMWQNYWSCVK